MGDPPVHERTYTVGGHQYLQRYRYVRDPTADRSLFQLLESRPLHPIYRRRLTDRPTSLPLAGVHLATLATALLLGTLSTAQVLSLVHDMAPDMPPSPALMAVGIRFDLEKTTAELLLWSGGPSPAPSAPSPPAPPAARGSNATASSRPNSRRSRSRAP